MNRSAFFGFSVLSVMLTGCCYCGSESDNGTMDSNDPLQAFAAFPDYLFEGIYWNQLTVEACQNLVANDFKLVDASSARTYNNLNDSTQVIVPGINHIHSLKLVLRSENYLAEKERLMRAFQNASTSSDQSALFSVFEYDLGHVDFKLTAFIQEDFIRLNFELLKRQ